jgi:hypothetical protein
MNDEQRKQGVEQKAQRTSLDSMLLVQRKLIIAFSVALFICFALAGFAIQYVGFVDRQRDETEERRNQQLCTVFGGIDKQYQANPPSTPAAQQFAADIHDLVKSLNCPQ